MYSRILENAKFKSFFEESTPSSNGIDKVTFKIRTNPNSEMGEIKNISYIIVLTLNKN